jgi:hypothetical protein
LSRSLDKKDQKLSIFDSVDNPEVSIANAIEAFLAPEFSHAGRARVK